MEKKTVERMKGLWKTRGHLVSCRPCLVYCLVSALFFLSLPTGGFCRGGELRSDAEETIRRKDRQESKTERETQGGHRQHSRFAFFLSARKKDSHQTPDEQQLQHYAEESSAVSQEVLPLRGSKKARQTSFQGKEGEERDQRGEPSERGESSHSSSSSSSRRSSRDTSSPPGARPPEHQGASEEVLGTPQQSSDSHGSSQNRGRTTSRVKTIVYGGLTAEEAGRRNGGKKRSLSSSLAIQYTHTPSVSLSGSSYSPPPASPSPPPSPSAFYGEERPGRRVLEVDSSDLLVPPPFYPEDLSSSSFRRRGHRRRLTFGHRSHGLRYLLEKTLMYIQQVIAILCICYGFFKLYEMWKAGATEANQDVQRADSPLSHFTEESPQNESLRNSLDIPPGEVVKKPSRSLPFSFSSLTGEEKKASPLLATSSTTSPSSPTSSREEEDPVGQKRESRKSRSHEGRVRVPSSSSSAIGEGPGRERKRKGVKKKKKNKDQEEVPIPSFTMLS